MTKIEAYAIHYCDQERLERLVELWPENDECSLTVVNNGSRESLAETVAPKVSLLEPGRNLGFGGGANLALRQSSAEWILLLNPDLVPEGDALEILLSAIDRDSPPCGFVPALFNEDGSSQHSWQLRPLPSFFDLCGQALLLPLPRGPRLPPPAGQPIGQPAAAALLLHRRTVLELGGLDEGFFPAWYEDVDLARRAAEAGLEFQYLPEARFVHARGGSVSGLGYSDFLWIYNRNLTRYVRKHYGRVAAGVVRTLIFASSIARAGALPLRRPRAATSHSEAFAGLMTRAVGSLSNWQRPKRLVQRYSPQR